MLQLHIVHGSFRKPVKSTIVQYGTGKHDEKTTYSLLC